MITAMAAKHDRVPPLLRAFGLLEHVASADGPVALQELAADAGLPKPTVYRMLAMLESAGLVTREPDGRRIAAGPRLMRFALDVQLSAAVRAPRHAILKRLADELGETVNLTMLDGSEVLYLDRVETEWPLRMTLQPGSHVPLHCGEQQLLLALLPPRGAASSPSCRCPATPTRRSDARRSTPSRDDPPRRPRDRQQEEYLAGLVCVAVPVSRTTAHRRLRRRTPPSRA
jgi:DNA-binding IclR family transcriptional regulator